MKEKEFIPFLWKWLEFKNEYERLNVPKGTKDSNKWKVGAIATRIQTDNDLDFKTLKRLAESESRYSYGHRMARMLKAAIIWAHREGMLGSLPKLDIRMPEPTFDHCLVHLTPEQIDEITDLPLEGKLWEARELWLFQRRTGLAYCDMKAFPNRMRRVDTKRNRYALINRQKTGSEAYIRLNDDLLRTINWMRTIKIPCLQTYNERLQEIEKLAGIEIRTKTGNTKSLTSHMGRKQCAQDKGEAGENHEAIKLQLGIKQDKSFYGSYLNKNAAILDAMLDQNSTNSHQYEPNQYRLFA